MFKGLFDTASGAFHRLKIKDLLLARLFLHHLVLAMGIPGQRPHQKQKSEDTKAVTVEYDRNKTKRNC